MKTFMGKIRQIRQDALDYIINVINKRGSGYELIDPNEYEEELTTEVYEMPRGERMNKYNYHVESAIVTIDINKNVVTFNGIDIGESEDGEYAYGEDELTTESICRIADIIRILEN